MATNPAAEAPAPDPSKARPRGGSGGAFSPKPENMPSDPAGKGEPLFSTVPPPDSDEPQPEQGKDFFSASPPPRDLEGQDPPTYRMGEGSAPGAGAPLTVEEEEEALRTAREAKESEAEEGSNRGGRGSRRGNEEAYHPPGSYPKTPEKENPPVQHQQPPTGRK